MSQEPRLWNASAPHELAAAAPEVADVLREGGVVAVPTETYYGLAASCRDRGALQRLLALKDRPDGQPLLLLVSNLAMAREVAPDAPPALDVLADALWPGPLTIVVPAPAWMPAEVTAGGTTVAVRQPAHPVPIAISEALGLPITGTSANRSGAPPVREAGAIELCPGERLDGIVDAGLTPGGPPSTLLDLTGSAPRILRAGAVDAETLTGILGVRLL